jgi:hypothetical protein
LIVQRTERDNVIQIFFLIVDYRHFCVQRTWEPRCELVCDNRIWKLMWGR